MPVVMHQHLADDGKRIYTHAHDEQGVSLIGNVAVSHEGMAKEVYDARG